MSTSSPDKQSLPSAIRSPIKQRTPSLRSPVKQSLRSSPIKSPSKSSRSGGRLSRAVSRLSMSDSSEIFDSPSVLLEIDQTIIKAGFPGDAISQVNYQLDTPLWIIESHDPNESINSPPLRLQLLNILHKILVQKLLVTPRHITVFVLESPIISNPIKQLIGQVLLLDLQVKSVTFQPSTVSSIIGAGTVHGLVVDFGWEEAVVTPVYDLRELSSKVQFTTRGTKKLLGRYRDAVTTQSFPSWHNFDHQRTLTSLFPLNEIEEIAKHTLLQDEGTNSDDNEYSIPRLINKVVANLDADLRGPCLENIVFVGGISSTSITNTIYESILKEVRLSWPKARQIHTIGGWSGASSYLSTTIARYTQQA